MIVAFKTPPHDLLDVIKALSTGDTPTQHIDILVTKEGGEFIVTAETVSLVDETDK